ncbi:hypothetical protein UA08_06876 [Talaromyces atroroseus]|uniref:Uncharacterized protein n=1 Tax=Talaromyces atroroseus TaxID=1441469 RepID=A0A225AI81_TALAT|nr:hypothetical protein UA08_06876 [Talaromyces atroroseus]OKL57934.1 hypothetical protein UA08_06876 [Talaromyces atroroseus]
MDTGEEKEWGDIGHETLIRRLTFSSCEDHPICVQIRQSPEYAESTEHTSLFRIGLPA